MKACVLSRTNCLRTQAAGPRFLGAECSGNFGDESRGKGKRGGVRVIYVHTPEANQVDLITVYGKDDADDLTKYEVAELCELARVLRAEAMLKAKRRRAKRKELTDEE
jgi:hypothetical protein